MTICASSRSFQDAVPTYLRSEQSCVLNSHNKLNCFEHGLEIITKSGYIKRRYQNCFKKCIDVIEVQRQKSSI